MAIPILGDVNFNYGELMQAVLWSPSAQDIVANHNDKQGLIFRDGDDGLIWYLGMGETKDKAVGICRGVMRAEVFNLIQTSTDGEYVIEHDFGEIYTTNPRIFWDIEGIFSDYPDGGAHTVLRHNVFIKNVYYFLDDANNNFKIRLKLLHRLYDEGGKLYSEQLLDEQIEEYAALRTAKYWENEGFMCTLHGDIMVDFPPRFRSVMFIKIEGVTATPPTTLHLELKGYYEVQEVNTWLAP